MSGPAKVTPRVCVVPGCRNSRRTRGLCHSHYQNCQRMLRDGTASEANLVERGLRLPVGEDGGSPIAKGSSDVFRFNR